MIGLRNRLMGVPEDFGCVPSRRILERIADSSLPQRRWLHDRSPDTYFPVALGDKPFYQVGFLLSLKGTDFESGGGFVVSKEDGEKVDVESAGGFGSLVVFDGKTIHGVDDVDTHKVDRTWTRPPAVSLPSSTCTTTDAEWLSGLAPTLIVLGHEEKGSTRRK